LVAAVAVMASTAVVAEPRGMSQSEFQDLLTGNTIVGEWSGRPYRQFFEPDGDTYFLEKGSRPTYGSWRIDPDGRYCSKWPPFGGWTCYRVERDGDALRWHTESGDVNPATVLQGRQMEW